MDTTELRRLVDSGQETQRVDFKSPFKWDDIPDYRAKLVLTAIAMANLRDGGSIVIGLSKDPSRPGYHTLSPPNVDQLDSFVPDQVRAYINERAAPHVDL